MSGPSGVTLCPWELSSPENRRCSSCLKPDYVTARHSALSGSPAWHEPSKYVGGDTTSDLKAVKGVKRTFPDWESLKTAMFPQPTLGVHRIPVKLRAACLLRQVTA